MNLPRASALTGRGPAPTGESERAPAASTSGSDPFDLLLAAARRDSTRREPAASEPDARPTPGPRRASRRSASSARDEESVGAGSNLSSLPIPLAVPLPALPVPADAGDATTPGDSVSGRAPGDWGGHAERGSLPDPESVAAAVVEPVAEPRRTADAGLLRGISEADTAPAPEASPVTPEPEGGEPRLGRGSPLPVEDPAAPATKASTEIPESLAGPAAGTGAADVPSGMNGTATSSKTAELERQELPGAAAIAASRLAAAERPATRLRRFDGTLTDSSEAQMAGGALPATAVPEAPAESSTKPESLRSLDPVGRLASLMEGAVVRFRRSGVRDIEVAVRADAQTEILLRVSFRGGTPEVQAELRRGDAAQFAAGWSDLQNRLAQQGIRLVSAPESAGAVADFSGDRGFSSRQERDQEVAERIDYRAAPVSRGMTPSIRAARPRTLQGWETWA